MYTLILIISLKSQFNHALDIRYVDNLTIQTCQHFGEVSKKKLKQFNPDVEVDISCEAKNNKGE
jgi:hypothetical protein